MKIEKWKEENLIDLKGKLIVVTGATGVIARFVIEGLLEKGASVVLCYRNFSRAVELQNELLNKFNNAVLFLEYLDLGDFACVKDFVKRMYSEYSEGIDAFINLAGCFSIPHRKSDIDLDVLFQTNAFVPCYLTEKMEDLLKLKNGRVVNVTSISHILYRGYDEENFEGASLPEIKRYALSKRFLTLYSLNKMKQKSSVILCHPGICNTNIIHPKNGGFSQNFYKVASAFMKVVFPPPEKMALCVLKAIIVPLSEGNLVSPSGGVYGFPKVKTLKYDSDMLEDSKFVVSKIESLIAKHN